MVYTFGPYSAIRQSGNTFYLAGHIGVDPRTNQAKKDVVAQTKQAIANLETTLESCDLTLEHIVKTTVFLTDMGDASLMNEVYIQFFHEPRPVRSTVAVKELPRIASVPLKVEIEAVACKIAQ